jgi:DNA-binding IclR family transcriptional regulator
MSAKSTSTSTSTHKALTLLKHVGIHHEQGIRLKELIEATGLDKSTAHRLLGCLVDEGFVEPIATTKLYRLGVESMQLGLSSANMAPLVDRFRPLMLKLARLTEDSVFLVVRSGDMALCVHREEGSYPVKVFLLAPGTRRLLCMSAVGLAILAHETDDEIARLYARHNLSYSKIGITLKRLRQLIAATRQQGFSEVTDFVLEQTAGVGYATRISASTQIGISIAAISARMPHKRRIELGKMLREEVDAFVRSTSPSLERP